MTAFYVISNTSLQFEIHVVTWYSSSCCKLQLVIHIGTENFENDVTKEYLLSSTKSWTLLGHIKSQTFYLRWELDINTVKKPITHGYDGIFTQNVLKMKVALSDAVISTISRRTGTIMYYASKKIVMFCFCFGLRHP